MVHQKPFKLSSTQPSKIQQYISVAENIHFKTDTTQEPAPFPNQRATNKQKIQQLTKLLTGPTTSSQQVLTVMDKARQKTQAARNKATNKHKISDENTKHLLPFVFYSALSLVLISIGKRNAMDQGDVSRQETIQIK